MSDMKRVLVIGMSPVYGGIEAFLINIFRNIDSTKVRMDFLTFCQKCACEEELIARGSEVFHLTRRGENPIKNKKELRDFFSSHADSYDYVWIQMSSASNITPNVMARKYTNAKIISHSHGTAFESSALAKPVHIVLDRLNRKKFIRCTDFCFACSEAAGKYLFTGFNEPVKVIKNGIDSQSYAYNPNIQAQIKHELDAENSTVIGHAGRLSAIKNQAFLIDMFKEYLKLDGNAVLAIAGDGELRQQLEEHAASLEVTDKVRFLGFRSDFNRLLQGFDLFVLPSFNEGLPLTLVEAQSSGLPCLASDTITNEVSLTELMHFAPLGDGAEKWAKAAKEIIDNSSQGRGAPCFTEAVRAAGFDAKDSAKDLQSFFSGKAE
ncbi:MAG: glycosyltransferase family 1 protein [Clostridiales bacterium]|nr:glycosyltransferase family 1 protein [Clostridiales bacterium]